MMNSCPVTKSEKALKKWKEAGPLNLMELVEEKKMDFDINLIRRTTKFHGNQYEGQVDSKGQKCGIGRLILYGHIHEGTWKDDKQCGYGR